MNRIAADSAWLEVDGFVAPFERAWAEGATPEPSDFAPAAEHPRHAEVLLELLRVDLEFRREKASARPFAEYLQRYASLLADAGARSALAFEDFRLRRRSGDNVRVADYVEQFGCDASDWSHRTELPPPVERPSTQAEPGGPTLRQTPSHPATEYPEVGSSILDFQLFAELGRGAFSRVYLAGQGELADRRVVLKLTLDGPNESDKLAQLQHSHIVPIYSTHRSGPFAIVCLPYFGSATLDDLLRRVRKAPAIPTDAAFVRTTIAATSRWPTPTLTAAVDGREEPRDYVDAVLRIGRQLAEGLTHAHRRGILHRDLKPANVLLADDGRAMLLDFNLSYDLKSSQRREAVIGGTLPYMAPEQLAAYHEHRDVADPRSDLFSLGVILYELLTGKHPFPSRRRGGAPSASTIAEPLERPTAPQELNRCIPPSVAALVMRCLAVNPNARYASAEDLAADLRRHFDDLPLRHAANPSWRERARKWARRHPRATSGTTIAVAAAVLLAAIGIPAGIHSRRLAQMESSVAAGRFHDDFNALRAACLVAAAPEADGSAAALEACRRALNGYGVFDRPDWQAAPDVERLASPERERLSTEVGELLYFMAATSRGMALKSDTEVARSDRLNEARALNGRARTAYPTRHIPQTVDYLDALLTSDLDGGDAPPFPAATEPTSAEFRDSGMQACLLTLEHRPREALPRWRQTLHHDPQNVWAYFGAAYCLEQVGELHQAAAHYTACVALSPNFVEAYYRRGLVHLRSEAFDAAGRDFDVAHNLQPERIDILHNRALARIGEERFAEGLADLRTVAAAAGDDSRRLLVAARALQGLGDAASAREYRLLALTKEPLDADSWVARGVARARQSPTEALADFERALKLHPGSQAALESKAHILEERLQRRDEAVATLDRAVRIYPEQSTLIAARGVLQARATNYDAARSDARRALACDDSPAVQYQVAGIFALCSKQDATDVDRALELLARALKTGYGLDLIAADPDLEPLHDEPRFRELQRAAEVLQTALRRSNLSPNQASAP